MERYRLKAPLKLRRRPGRAKGCVAANDKWNRAYIEVARNYCMNNGATTEELARLFAVSVSTIRNWEIRHPEFANAITVGREVPDKRVERRMYEKALGYSFEEELVRYTSRGWVRTTVTRHVPPDTTAMIFWLKNRRPDLWRDVNRYEHTGKDGNAISVLTLPPNALEGCTPEELAVLEKLFGRLQEGGAAQEQQPTVDPEEYGRTIQ